MKNEEKKMNEKDKEEEKESEQVVKLRKEIEDLMNELMAD